MKIDTSIFIERAKQVHGDKYDYTETVYHRSTEKVKIICPVHGLFLQRPENHVNQKQDCPTCANSRKGKQERFSAEWLLEHPERAYSPALLYVADVQDKHHPYIEVGITTKSIKRGYTAKPNTKMTYLHYMSLKEALFLGEEIENSLKDFVQGPTVFFHGKTKRLPNTDYVRDTLQQILPKN